MSATEPLSAVDTAWFRLDEKQNTADIVALITFAEPLDILRLKEIVKARFLAFDRFRQRVVDPGGSRPFWEDDPDLDIERHLQHHRLEHGTLDELHQFVSGVLTRDLKRDRPLWEIHVVENVDGGGALVAKIHHCVGDGFALVGVLLSLSDESPAPEPEGHHEADSRVGFRAQVLNGLSDLAAHPSQIVDAARVSSQVAQSLGELVLLPFDSDSSLKRELTGIRKAAWSSGIALDRFKHVAHQTGGTVNDVLMTALAGALRNWMLSVGDDVELAHIKALVPVNLRPVEDIGKELGNKFGLVFLEMPVASPELTTRLESIRASMKALKESAQAVVSFGILGALGHGPETIEHLVGDIFTRKGSLVVTNVPGPREVLHIAGKKVDHIMFWVPHPARLGLGVSLLSYAGEVRIGVRADTGVMTDPNAIVRGFEAELAAMEAATE